MKNLVKMTFSDIKVVMMFLFGGWINHFLRISSISSSSGAVKYGVLKYQMFTEGRNFRAPVSTCVADCIFLIIKLTFVQFLEIWSTLVRTVCYLASDSKCRQFRTFATLKTASDCLLLFFSVEEACVTTGWESDSSVEQILCVCKYRLR